MFQRRKRSNNNETQKLIDYWTKQNRIRSLYNEQAHASMFKRECKNIVGKKILDIGCGQGRILEYLTQHGAKVSGIDISQESMAAIRRRGYPVVAGDTRRLPFKNNRFDIVFSLGVVEHFKETEEALQEHLRVCREGGKVIVAVPNLISPYSASYIYHFVRGSYRMGLAACGKRYSKKTLKKMLLDIGLEDVDVKTYYGSIFLRLLPIGFRSRLAKMIDQSWLIRHFGHLLWGQGIKPQGRLKDAE